MKKETEERSRFALMAWLHTSHAYALSLLKDACQKHPHACFNLMTHTSYTQCRFLNNIIFHTHSNSNSVLIRLKTSTSKYSIGMSCILCTKIQHPYCTMLKHIHMYTHTRVEQVVGSEKRHIKAYNLATKAPSHHFSLMSKFSAKNSFAEGGVSRTFGQDWRHFVLVNSKLVKMIQNGTYLLVNLGRNKVRDRTMVRRRTIPKTTPKIRKSYPIWWKKN